MTPVPPAMATELAAETLGVAAVEYKLIAELHEVYGLRVPGTTRERASAYLWSWTEQRGIDVLKPSSVSVALGTSMKRQLRQRLLRRSLRNIPSLAPFMIGAVVGALLNRRDTLKLAEHVRDDLRDHQRPWASEPELTGPDDAGLTDAAQTELAGAAAAGEPANGPAPSDGSEPAAESPGKPESPGPSEPS